MRRVADWHPAARSATIRCMTKTIETHALAKSFGNTRALGGIDLSVREGSVYGLLGPNGAGKTTLIRILMGLLIASAGRARMLGLDCFEDRVARPIVVINNTIRITFFQLLKKLHQVPAVLANAATIKNG